MSLSRQPGSAVALALAADPAVLPVIMTVAGVALTVSAAVFAYHEYEAYEENKHKKEIEVVNELHQKFLAKISIPDAEDIKGFPAIFKFRVEDKAEVIESMHMTEEQVRDVGQNCKRCDDESLQPYRQAILDAILKLQEYYFIKDKNSVTSRVICYLLYMLETKCLNFQGYDYDIGYLSALIHFINAYASLKNTTKTQHFSRFNAVYRCLMEAKQSLERHRELLSLDEMIRELKDFCVFESDHLIRYLMRMFVENNNEIYIQTVTMDELSHNILRQEYIRSAFSGMIFDRDNEIHLPHCIFTEWVVALSRYYLYSTDVISNIKEDEITLTTKIFSDVESKQQKKYWEAQKLFEQIKAIRAVFKETSNYISTKAIDKDLIPVNDTQEVIERTKMIYRFALLTHQVISLQYLCMQLLKSLKQLGEVYVKNPNHFRHIFILLSLLCQKIKENTVMCKNDIENIQIMNGDRMQLDSFQLFPEEVKTRLDNIGLRINRLEDGIKDYREKAIKELSFSEVETEIKNHMLETAHLIENLYQLKIEVPEEKDEIEEKSEAPAAHLSS